MVFKSPCLKYLNNICTLFCNIRCSGYMFPNKQTHRWTHTCTYVLRNSELADLLNSVGRSNEHENTASCFFNANPSEGVGLMISASIQIHCVTPPITTSDYWKGCSVTFGNLDIYSVFLVVAQSVLSQSLNIYIKNTDFFSIVDKNLAFHLEDINFSSFHNLKWNELDDLHKISNG